MNRVECTAFKERIYTERKREYKGWKFTASYENTFGRGVNPPAAKNVVVTQEMRVGLGEGGLAAAYKTRVSCIIKHTNPRDVTWATMPWYLVWCNWMIESSILLLCNTLIYFEGIEISILHLQKSNFNTFFCFCKGWQLFPLVLIKTLSPHFKENLKFVINFKFK